MGRDYDFQSKEKTFNMYLPIRKKIVNSAMCMEINNIQAIISQPTNDRDP